MSREDAPAFSFGIVRNLLNEPPLLTRIKNGEYRRKYATLKDCLDDILKKYLPMETNPYDRAESFFTQRPNTCTHLEMSQKVAINVYTMANPPIYTYMGKSIWSCKNGQPDTDLELFGDLVFDIIKGMEKIREGPDPPPVDCVLYKIAWIQQEDYDAYFKVGGEVKFQGFSSAASSPQWQFMEVGKRPGCIPVLLIYDKVMSKQAADIRQLSVFQPPIDEDERLFEPYLRGKITEVTRRTNPKTNGEVTAVHITSLRRPPVLPEVLAAPAAETLEAALMLGLHCKDQASGFLDILSNIDTDLSNAVSFRDPEVVDKQWKGYFEACNENFYKSVCALGGLNPWAAIWWSCGKDMTSMFVLGTEGKLVDFQWSDEGKRERLQAQKNQEVDKARHGYSDQSLKAITERGLSVKASESFDRTKGPFGMLKQQCEKYREGIQQINNMCSRSGEEDSAERKKEQYDIEREVMGIWVNTCITLRMGSGIVDQQPEAEKGFKSQFSTITESCLDTMLELGDQLLCAERPSDELEAARHVKGNLQLLRSILGSTRVILPIGDPDAGKSTLLKVAYGIKVPVGLGDDGRTPVLSLHPHPSFASQHHSPVLVADVPGFGDTGVRDDITMMLLELACSEVYRKCFVIQICIIAGRPLQGPLKKVIEKLKEHNVTFEFLLSKVDKRFDDMVKDRHQKFKDKEEGAESMQDPAARERVAKQIQRDVEEQVQGADYVFTKLAGWGAAVGSAEKEEIVPGLHMWLSELKLSKYFEAALAWAEEAGACSLEEVIGCLDEFTDSLELKKLEKQRLQKDGVAKMELVQAALEAGTATRDEMSDPENDDQPSSRFVKKEDLRYFTPLLGAADLKEHIDAKLGIA